MAHGWVGVCPDGEGAALLCLVAFQGECVLHLSRIAPQTKDALG
jgi:hypothetical protein